MFDLLKKKLKDSISTIQSKILRKEEEIPKKAEEAGGKVQKPSSILSHRVTEEDISSIYSGIKESLIDNNVALSVLEEIHADLKEELTGESVSIINSRQRIEDAIKRSISKVIISEKKEKFMEMVKSKKPYIILFIGVNGVGKTTTIAKVASLLKKEGLKPVVSASDTFRAASIEQLELHCRKLNVDLVKHSYGADPAAVAYDAINHAKSTGADAVLIDTAGRSDMNKNLIEELAKVKKVSKPDLTIFVGDALTGNDLVSQAKIFNEKVGFDMSIVAKADVDKKGGAVLSLSYVTKKPILFIGTGQGYDDLATLDPEKTAKFILE
ncbi:MAG: signal recognition particle-docking protein FtsY [Candidatus Parvarchaeota archaeon]|nr:signal recognition particle-docking protein FtsY [Candidatus Parvarchaeota archaeon]